MNSNTYDEYYSGGALRKRWDWGATPRMYYEYDIQGNVIFSREFNTVENEAANARERSEASFTTRNELMQQLSAGVADIEAAVTQAGTDAQNALTQRTQADVIKTGATTQRTQIASFNASPTYQAAQLTAIKGQLDQLAARDEIFAQAFADHFTWRNAVDLSMVKVYNALLWMARVATGKLED